VARSIFFYTDSVAFGGAEKALFMLIDALDREAWEPTLLLGETAADPSLAEHVERLDLPVRTVRPMPLGVAGAAAVPGFARFLRRRRPDVFHAHMNGPTAAKYALAAAVLARVPATVGTVQLFPRFEIDRSNRLQLRLLASGVGRYLAVSRDLRGLLIEELGWPAAKIDVVYNAARLHRPSPRAAELRAELTGDGRPLVLTVARLDPQKGHPFLLEAAAELPGAVFALAGEGADRAALEARATVLGVADRVRFLGHRDDVPDLLAACDVFALPSLFEGSSLAVLEAMAAGKPVLSCAVGGTDELIDDGEDGLLAAPADAAALAAALRRLLGDPALCAALGRRARERVERDFSPARTVEQVTAVYAELLGDA
jgi:glycosyltransferase involved in cell wall biosynthesis